MDEVAPVAVQTRPSTVEVFTTFGLVLVVCLLVLEQFVGAMGKLAPSLVGTFSELHELPT